MRHAFRAFTRTLGGDGVRAFLGAVRASLEFADLALSPGTRFGPYEIVSALGAGAMGEVYRARDTRLDLDVDRQRRKWKFPAPVGRCFANVPKEMCGVSPQASRDMNSCVLKGVL